MERFEAGQKVRVVNPDTSEHQDKIGVVHKLTIGSDAAYIKLDGEETPLVLHPRECEVRQ